jgi:hypothetical protein
VIFRRILFLLAGATMLSVSAGVIVIALAYALFALVRPYWGPAGASAAVAGAAALLIGLIGLTFALMGRRPKKKASEPESVTERVVEFVKSKPITSVVGAVAAGILAIRNPGYLGSAIRSFVEGREPPSQRRERRK